MKSRKGKAKSQFLLTIPARLTRRRAVQSGKGLMGLGVQHAMFLLLVTAIIAAVSVQAKSQSLDNSLTAPAIIARGEVNPTYLPPTQRTMLKNYTFDAFGPYPMAGAAVAAGMNQYSNAPPEWVLTLLVTARGLVRISPSRRLEPRRATDWRKYSRKIRCTTGVNAAACFHG